MLSNLKEIIPGSSHWPSFTHNNSNQFEARQVLVKIAKSNSILFKGMHESIIPIIVSHGEGKVAVSESNDLKKITGVGPVLQKKLNAMGLFTLQQISKMTNQEYDLFDEILGELPGRAKRDDWAGQASKLKNN